MSGVDWIIKWSTALAVRGGRRVASYEHAYERVRAHGEAAGRLAWSHPRSMG